MKINIVDIDSNKFEENYEGKNREKCGTLKKIKHYTRGSEESKEEYEIRAILHENQLKDNKKSRIKGHSRKNSE